MSLYDGVKDAMGLVDKVHNLDLYQKLVDLSVQAVELQNQVKSLSDENKDLQEKLSIQAKIERHPEHYITLEGDELLYCANCWDSERKLIQLVVHRENGTCYCSHCKENGVYDEGLCQAAERRAQINRENYRPY